MQNVCSLSRKCRVFNGDKTKKKRVFLNVNAFVLFFCCILCTLIFHYLFVETSVINISFTLSQSILKYAQNNKICRERSFMFQAIFFSKQIMLPFFLNKYLYLKDATKNNLTLHITRGHFFLYNVKKNLLIYHVKLILALVKKKAITPEISYFCILIYAIISFIIQYSKLFFIYNETFLVILINIFPF